MVLPGGSACKESTCNEGDLSSIPKYAYIFYRNIIIYQKIVIV